MDAVKVSGPAGLRITVKLASQAYVYLMDWANYQTYQRSGKARGQGGWAVRSPVQFTKPDAADWYIVVHDQAGGHPKYEVTTS